jgi:3-deoxy-D-manno-octulosonic-acid transferase
MFLLYNLLLTLFSPLWVPWMLWRTSRRKEKPNWAERQGDFPIAPDKEAKRIWVHAVSVGEVVAALPILRAVREELPEYEIVLSVTTSSGHQTAREKASDLFHHLVYFPIDTPRFQLAGMSRVRPQAVAVMETELWFNFLWAAKSFRAKTLLINGRISDRSFPRARLFRFFFRSMLQNVDRCLMQSERDADRILALGAGSAEVMGNCKFDEAAEGLDADPAEWRNALGLDGGVPVLVIGSTRSEFEERLVLDAVQALGLDRIQVVHAPRHLERAEPLAAEVSRRFGSVARRSRQERGRYLILDSYGELNRVYAAADAVIVGGGFDNLGGQNLIQPLAHGKPVLHGPHMQNFRDVSEAARHAGATLVCQDAAELASGLEAILSDVSRRKRMGEAARNLVQQNLGASARYARAIAEAVRP